jgi:SAM-dependent methyltransferase
MSGRLPFAAEREEAELEAYLGDEYRQSSLHDYEGVLDAELDSIGDERELYRSSRAYLYNLTAFAMTGTKLPYLRMLTEAIAPGSRVLDYGCGIGSDGLLLLEMGYRVEFADFANPSTEYLRWRLERRGFEAPIHDLDRGVPGGFDLAYAFDVIEHVPDPFAFLAEMECRAERVQVNLLEFDPNEQALHARLPIRRLLARAARRGLERYRILHETSHVVIYETSPVSLPRRIRNLALVAETRARRLAGGVRDRVRQS